MKMSNDKMLKIGIIAVGIIIVILVIVMLFTKKEKNVNQNLSNQKVDPVLKASSNIVKVKSISEWDNINYCTNKFLNYIADKKSDIVYNMLIKDYISTEEVTEQNVLNKIEKINKDYVFNANNVYSLEMQLGKTTYFAQGKIFDKNSKKSTDYGVILNIDYANNSFEIAPMKSTYSKYVDTSDINNISIKNEDLKNEIKGIKKNASNVIQTKTAYESKDIANFYFKQYVFNMVYNTKEAYNMLDKDYAEKRFGDYEKFKKYVASNGERIEKSALTKYKVEEFKDYKEYLCKDSLNNYYIFKEKSPMEYTVLLDQYTIEDKFFVEKYNQKNDDSKMQMNLAKFEQMLNRFDYSKAYEVLNKEFKEKFFSTEDKFIEYVKDNLYIYNSFEYLEVTTDDEGKTRVKTQISNIDDYTKNTIKRFRVELLDEGKFSISFDM